MLSTARARGRTPLVSSDAVYGLIGGSVRMNDQTDLKTRGFTFTELLVVVSLGAILAGTILPALNTAQDTMKAAVWLGNMHQWSLAISLYVADQKDYYPFHCSYNNPPFTPGNTDVWRN